MIASRSTTSLFVLECVGLCAAIKFLAEDRQHGAAQLAVHAVQALAQEAQRLARQAAASGSMENEGAGAAALDAIRNFGWHLACCRPQMVPIANSVAAVLAGAHEDLRARCGKHTKVAGLG